MSVPNSPLGTSIQYFGGCSVLLGMGLSSVLWGDVVSTPEGGQSVLWRDTINNVEGIWFRWGDYHQYCGGYTQGIQGITSQ